jgi:4-amino-4-deoxy-L-arabinose transferase-like glycosyltransferase
VPVQARSRNRRVLWTLAATIAFSVVLSAGLTVTRRPWCDEGWFASPALNLMRHGFMGMTILDPHGYPFATYVQGIARHTYWIMPGYFLFQIAWYTLIGFHLFSMRAISVFWSVAALGAYYFVIEWLVKQRGTALLATALLGTEQTFVMLASTARMDMMTAALDLLAIAFYVKMRERNVDLAYAGAGFLLAAGTFTHPNAVIDVLTLAFIILWFDARRVSVKRAALAAAPFVVLAAMWGLYISEAPADCISQFQAQRAIPHRLQLSRHVLEEVKFEVLERYKTYKPGFSSWQCVDSLVLVSYLLAAAAIALVPRIRKRPGALLLLLLTVVHFALLVLIQKNAYYLVYILPYYTALMAVVAAWLWESGRSARVVCAGWLLLITGLNVGISGLRIVHNDYQNRYQKMVAYIREHRKPGDLTIGSGDIGFGLGFEGEVIDDPRLGYLSGKVPEFIVVDAHYYYYWFPLFHAVEPKAFAFLFDKLAHDYDLVYDEAHDNYRTLGGFSDFPYQVFRRKHTDERN